jgi:hypothetical protein
MDRLLEQFHLIEPQLIRYPAIDPAAFRAAIAQFCHEHEVIRQKKCFLLALFRFFVGAWRRVVDII